MPALPAERVELPLLMELRATGGSDDRRFVVRRLLRYFPQLDGPAPEGLPPAEPDPIDAARRRFQRLVGRAAARLEDRGELRRERTRLVLTDKGWRRAEAEALRPDPPPAPPPGTGPTRPAAQEDAHLRAQQILVEIGLTLGHHAEAEFDTYDVVWRRAPASPRLSHVFEVQVRGSVDGALARLKRAHEVGRSQLFLIVSDERSSAFAHGRLRTAFPELLPLVRVIGLGELCRLHQALAPHQELITDLLGEG